MKSNRNEILFNGKLSDLKKIIKKNGGKDVYNDFDKKILLIDSFSKLVSCDDLNRNNKEVFFWSLSNNKFFINRFIESSYEQIDMSEEFFNEIAKYAINDFKVSFLNKDNFKLVFCICKKGKIYYEHSTVMDWEDPLYFEDIPYFVKLAKESGMKKKRDEYGDKRYDSEEIYDLIYDFRDNLLSGDDTYLKMAPDWYLEM
jgi:hypothetical protein